ncbi:phosphatidylglycerophosphatase A family protein [Inhella gelatinilytica]|uniref:Phosphatidylglycerophosphatase A n=1 Tax=Inhella gelatinilytica TaxID=2795030 RepID=A0A931IXC2_9BURK|nr:phosphatidylglycerophosphatase A [Inhella gelatinilytica]MBH9551738.1 phosphatidylglycerophosphatase A [Inhella gelatinilytica]
MSTHPSFRFMVAHPARWIALGLGSGLSPKAPGTAGTLAAWVGYALLSRWFGPAEWLMLLVLGAAVGVWACTRCAQHLGMADPGAIVWDEVLAFWGVLWAVGPVDFWQQAVLFGLFRLFDAAKPGPVRWADQAFKLRPGEAIGWRQGLGIMLDDFVAAACTLGVWFAAVALLR